MRNILADKADQPSPRPHRRHGSHRENEIDNQVFVVEYNPKWPMQFRSLQGRIVGALRQLAVAVEHVGSTAVPGLVSKPILDIDVLLAPGSTLPVAIQRLATLGYVHLQGDSANPERETLLSPGGATVHHLYLYPYDSSRVFRKHVVLRNYLRTHPPAATEYGQLKKTLALRCADDPDAYTAGKSEFVATMTNLAMDALGR